MTKTPDEIKKGLENCTFNKLNAYRCEECTYSGSELCLQNILSDVLALIQQLEVKNNALWNTLVGVMHFVDKWLDDAGYDPESDTDGSDAINRAAKAREIALKAIEEAEKLPPF